MLESACFSQVILDFSHDKTAQDISFDDLRAILFSSYGGTHKNGEPRVSLDLDTNRITLLDRVTTNEQETEQIPF